MTRHYLFACILLFSMTCSVGAVDNWEQIAIENGGKECNQSIASFQEIKDMLGNGFGLSSLRMPDVGRLTCKQLGELDDHLATYRESLIFTGAHLGEETFWNHLARMREEIYTPASEGSQGCYATSNGAKKEHIDRLHALLLESLINGWNLSYDHDPVALMNPDSMYYLQRRLIDQENRETKHGDTNMFTIIRSKIIKGEALHLIRSHNLHDLSLRQLDEIKNQLSIYSNAFCAANRYGSDDLFWLYVTRLRESDKKSEKSKEVYSTEINACEFFRALVQKELVQRLGVCCVKQAD